MANTVNYSALAAADPFARMQNAQTWQEGNNRKSYLYDVGQQLASGDMQGAAQSAFATGDPQMINTGMQLQNISMERGLKMANFFSEAAQRADTPERWAKVVAVGRQLFGPKADEYADFNTGRPNAITAFQQVQLDIQQQAERRAAELHPYQKQKLEAEAGKLTAEAEAKRKLAESGIPDLETALKLAQLEGHMRDKRKEEAAERRNYVSPEWEMKAKTADALGYSPALAAMFASNGLRLEIDPVTRKKFLTDFAGNPVDPSAYQGALGDAPRGGGAPPQGTRPISQSVQQGYRPVSSDVPGITVDQGNSFVDTTRQPAPSGPARGSGLYQTAPSITGLGPSLGEKASDITENLPIGSHKWLSDDQQRNMGKFDVLKRRVMTLLAVNPKMPVYEQEILSALMDRGTFTSPSKLRAKMMAIDDLVRDRMADNVRTINNRELNPEMRKEAQSYNVAAEGLLRALDVPPKLAPQELEAAVNSGQIRDGDLFRSPVTGKVFVFNMKKWQKMRGRE